MLESIKNIHFIGIGGAGMSAIAHVLVKRGYLVTGSDATSSAMATKLAKDGAIVYIGHAACQIEGAEAVVISTAIHQNNPELLEARKRQIPVLHRSDVLAELINNAKGVAVAGAHGKTTTSSMISCICTDSGIDPTVIIGGIVSSLGGNARNGKGEVLVAEADESDGSFLKFNPHIAVVTNIENDHMDHYGSEENIYKAFYDFLGNIVVGGKAVLCFDNEKIRSLAHDVNVPILSYGIEHNEADYTAENIVFSPTGTTYDFMHKQEKLATVNLIIPGKHNILNSMAALVTALELGIDLESALVSLKCFSGAKRRFETKGRIDGIWVVDDYAHHPTEIKVTLAAARQTKPKRLICAFQPHRYTRTQLLLKDFGGAFKDCDELILTDVYSAGEEPISGISGETLAAEVERQTQQKVHYIPKLEDIQTYLLSDAKPGDLIMTVGAGNIYAVGETLVDELKRGHNHE